MDIEQITEQAFQLPASARELLAEALVASLDNEESFELSAAWRAEIEKRCAELDTGLSVLVPAEQVLAKLRAHYE